MAITIKDVALKAGVSPATASRVIGAYGYTSHESRTKVLKAAEELNYHPNAVAKSMVAKRTYTIALIVTDLDNPFFVELINEVETAAQDSQYSIVFSNTHEEIEKERIAVRTMIERQVDGVLIVPVGEYRSQAHRRHFKWLYSANVPCVFIDRYIYRVHADSVIIDNFTVAYQATRNLLDDGHNDIALVRPNQRINTITDRERGFEAAFTDRDPELCTARIVTAPGYRSEDAYAAMQELLSAKIPDAFLTLDYQMTAGTMRALFEAGLTSTHQMRIVGFDNMKMLEMMLPFKVTTIPQPVRELARVAIGRLKDRIDQGTQQTEGSIITVGLES